MKKLTPLAKGLITGVVVLGLQLAAFYTNSSVGSKLGYLMYVAYAAGIIWTLAEYQKYIHSDAKFGDLFGQGFRCFIIVTLIMVLFTWIFSATHPEFAEKDTQAYRQFLVDQKEKMPAQIDDMVADYKKHYTTGLIYPAIFGYLIIGSIITAGTAGLLLLRKR